MSAFGSLKLFLMSDCCYDNVVGWHAIARNHKPEKIDKIASLPRSGDCSRECTRVVRNNKTVASVSPLAASLANRPGITRGEMTTSPRPFAAAAAVE